MPSHRHTIYDALEASGTFLSNPANVGSRDPVEGISIYRKSEFPRMVYAPERRVTQEAEILVTPMGAKEVNRKTELVHKIVGSQAELDEALAAGWFSTPARAMDAAGEKAPAASPAEEVADLQAELAELRAKLAAQAPAMGADSGAAVAEAQLAARRNTK